MAHYSDQVPGTHDNADKKTVFSGYAALEKSGVIQCWSYHPIPLLSHIVEVDVTHCGICGSDIHTIDSGWGPSNYPCIVGHEIVGTVTAVGSAVKHLKVGDRVGVGAQIGSCLNKHGNCPECGAGNQQHCRNGLVFTYNGQHAEEPLKGQWTFGGYGDRVRLPAEFAFVLPASIPSNVAGPLMCAGATVFSPLHRHGAAKGKKVAIVGVGGLGHMALKFAVAMGADVTAISTSNSKEADTKKWGVQHFLNSKDPAAIQAAFRTFDLVLATADLTGAPLNDVLSTVKFGGTYCFVGVPEKPIEFAAFGALMGRVNITSSLIGSIDEIKLMLQFAADHKVFPDIQEFPLEKVNDAIKTVRDNTVRYRCVLVHKK